jgi:hypothetical protein
MIQNDLTIHEVVAIKTVKSRSCFEDAYLRTLSSFGPVTSLSLCPRQAIVDLQDEENAI